MCWYVVGFTIFFLSFRNKKKILFHLRSMQKTFYGDSDWLFFFKGKQSAIFRLYCIVSPLKNCEIGIFMRSGGCFQPHKYFGDTIFLMVNKKKAAAQINKWSHTHTHSPIEAMSVSFIRFYIFVAHICYRKLIFNDQHDDTINNITLLFFCFSMANLWFYLLYLKQKGDNLYGQWI